MSFIRARAVLTLLLSAPLPTVAGCTADVIVDAPVAGAAQPGRPAGAPCAFDTQCATHSCSADVDAETCGECVTIEALGHDCTGPHQGCSTSAVCKDGVCQSMRKVKGEACSFGGKGGDLSECDVELYCAHVGDSHQLGTCLPRTPVGGSCAYAHGSCVREAECNRVHVCAVPVSGACVYGYSCGDRSYCGDDLLCHPGTLPQNAACGIFDRNLVDNKCGPGLVCGRLEHPSGGSTDRACIPLPGKGAPCVQHACGEGLFCFQPPEEDDTAPYCDAPREEGEACRNDNYRHVPCAAGLECRTNTCRVACQ
jgi:hypothetical protein